MGNYNKVSWTNPTLARSSFTGKSQTENAICSMARRIPTVSAIMDTRFSTSREMLFSIATRAANRLNETQGVSTRRPIVNGNEKCTPPTPKIGKLLVEGGACHGHKGILAIHWQ